MSQVFAGHIVDRHVTLPVLFFEFLKISLCSFGGGLIWARRFVVDQRQWLSEHEFADILSICQFMPGPNMIGVAVCAGARLRGPLGAVAAASGFILVPCALGLPLGAVYLQYAHSVFAQHLVAGISAAAAGLLIATGISMLRPHRGHFPSLFAVALSIVGITVAKLPLLLVLLGLAPVSIALARRETRRSAQ